MNTLNLPEAMEYLTKRWDMVPVTSEVPINCSNNIQAPTLIIHRLNTRIILSERLANAIVDIIIANIAIKAVRCWLVLLLLSTKLKQSPSMTN